jgi:flagellar biosynthetic protein FliQ
MDVIQSMQLIKDALIVALMVCAPPIGAGLAIGIFVSIVQTTMSIQEQTLTFVPKILGMALTLVLFGQWMLNILMDYTSNLFINLPNIVR